MSLLLKRDLRDVLASRLEEVLGEHSEERIASALATIDLLQEGKTPEEKDMEDLRKLMGIIGLECSHLFEASREPDNLQIEREDI